MTHRLVWLALAAGANTTPIAAQRRPEVQVGTFLTRDNGWNWALNLSGRLGLAHRLTDGWWGVGYVVGRMSACPCGEVPQIPLPPQSIENGLGAGYEIHRRMLSDRVTTLLGAEWFHVVQEELATGGTLVGTAGLGWYWGDRRAWGTELRYERFARRLSATRGRLEWTVVRR
ncbi:MAG: hypothetical protein IT361_05975 [Gemmatimonadaceae bacterium]|nr:hypothetical protein [Gemmatimonadaceae bacterium]